MLSCPTFGTIKGLNYVLVRLSTFLVLSTCSRERKYSNNSLRAVIYAHMTDIRLQWSAHFQKSKGNVAMVLFCGPTFTSHRDCGPMWKEKQHFSFQTRICSGLWQFSGLGRHFTLLLSTSHGLTEKEGKNLKLSLPDYINWNIWKIPVFEHQFATKDKIMQEKLVFSKEQKYLECLTCSKSL